MPPIRGDSELSPNPGITKYSGRRRTLFLHAFFRIITDVKID